MRPKSYHNTKPKGSLDYCIPATKLKPCKQTLHRNIDDTNYHLHNL